MGDMGDKHAFL